MPEVYKVVRRFKDTKHDDWMYRVGDQYPAEGFKTTKARVKQLATSNNAYGQIYIALVEE